MKTSHSGFLDHSQVSQKYHILRFYMENGCKMMEFKNNAFYGVFDRETKHAKL